MATIEKLCDKKRDKPWRARIRRKGHPQLIKMFRTRANAERWARRQEDSIETFDLPLTIEALKHTTLRELVKRYVAEITPTKGCAASEAIVLNKFMERDICKLSLAAVSVTSKHAHDYIALRLKELWNGRPITPRTVRRELNSISHVFTTAKQKWGFDNLRNPFEGIRIKGSSFKRTRVLRPGEDQLLLAACESCRGLNKYYARLVILLAMCTGMRLQEIFNLHWRDIDRAARTITITESKTDDQQLIPGRVIVMPYLVEMVFETIEATDRIHRAGAANGLIFPMSKEAFKQTWNGLVKRAGIPSKEEDRAAGIPEHACGLEFLDLRREAGSQFNAADLNADQHDLMLGHNSNKIRGIYIAPAPSVVKAIADKLDRYTFDKTRDELRPES
jgi:integrase